MAPAAAAAATPVATVASRQWPLTLCGFCSYRDLDVIYFSYLYSTELCAQFLSVHRESNDGVLECVRWL